MREIENEKRKKERKRKMKKKEERKKEKSVNRVCVNFRTFIQSDC